MKHHCIINQVSLFGKSLKMQHVMKTVVKFINKIRAKELIHTKFKEYCKILEIENDNLIIFGNWKYFWKLKDLNHYFFRTKKWNAWWKCLK